MHAWLMFLTAGLKVQRGVDKKDGGGGGGNYL